MFLFVGAELFIMTGLYFFQPETKNRSNTEIDILYSSKVSPRKFENYLVVQDQVVERKKKPGFFDGLAKHVGRTVC